MMVHLSECVFLLFVYQFDCPRVMAAMLLWSANKIMYGYTHMYTRVAFEVAVASLNGKYVFVVPKVICRVNCMSRGYVHTY